MNSPTLERALMNAIEPLLRAALEADSSLGEGDDAPLDLRSIEVVVLVDLLESTFDVVFGSDDVRPEHFATRRTLAALLIAKGAQCA